MTVGQSQYLSLSLSLSLSSVSKLSDRQWQKVKERRHRSISLFLSLTPPSKLCFFLSFCFSLSLHLRFSVSPRSCSCVPLCGRFEVKFSVYAEIFVSPSRCMCCCFSFLVYARLSPLCMLDCLLCSSLVNNLLQGLVCLVCSQGVEINTVWYLCKLYDLQVFSVLHAQLVCFLFLNVSCLPVFYLHVYGHF